MAILEKYKYYNDFISDYISTRFGILKFSGFAFLLALLGVTEIIDWEKLGINFLFLFASLFVFRLIDDAWSFHLDRINHPERTYLNSENIRRFVAFSALTSCLYLAVLFFASLILAQTILVLLLVSSALYFSFYKMNGMMKIIPLLKYPVFIWCALSFSTSIEVLILSAGAFFMVYTSDFIDENPVISSKLISKLVLLLITGLFIFQPGVEGSGLIPDLIIITIPLILIAFTSIKGYAFYPIIVYPILHIIDLIF